MFVTHIATRPSVVTVRVRGSAVGLRMKPHLQRLLGAWGFVFRGCDAHHCTDVASRKSATIGPRPHAKSIAGSSLSAAIVYMFKLLQHVQTDTHLLHAQTVTKFHGGRPVLQSTASDAMRGRWRTHMKPALE